MVIETVGIVLSSVVLVIILSVVVYYIIKYVKNKIFGSGLAGTRPDQNTLYPFDETGTRKAEYPFDKMGERNVSKYIKQRLFPIPTKPMQKRVSSGWGENMISQYRTKKVFPKKKQSPYVMDGPIDVNEISEPDFTQLEIQELMELYHPSSPTNLTQTLYDYDTYAPHTTNMLDTIKEERGPRRRFFTFRK